MRSVDGPGAGELVVRGEAERPVEPERATVWLTVWGAGARPSAAMDALAPRAAALDGVLDDRSAAIATRTTAALTLHELFDHRNGRTVTTGFEAQRTTSVDVVDLGAVAGLLRAAVDVAEARVRGPAWSIGADHPVHREVRVAAATDARRRAEAYAAGLDVAVGGVEWIRDADMERGDGMPRMRGFAASPAAPMGPGAPVNVDSGQIIVHAAVEVAFRLLTP